MIERTPAELRETIELLQERIAQLESILGQSFVAPAHWGLSHKQEKLVGLLMARERVTAEAILSVVWHGEEDAGAERVHTLVSKMRPKLKALGADVECSRYTGYRLIGRENLQIHEARQ
ncbi:winged helix family transcriptional regulator [Fulvimarina endophytica]|uniref:Winged helix family transcriptional regulator n=1 Tax=Fulvimarina endophytica TaxID=2293836 RepID=A0A371XB66_9HYPH|nr:winged helix-turn-helix domain-containing protein [Fulvimarina endophytica]RFC66477.1 winged helix family transcriptional regulator [Fulvimarina endophytica]